MAMLYKTTCDLPQYRVGVLNFFYTITRASVLALSVTFTTAVFYASALESNKPSINQHHLKTGSLIIFSDIYYTRYVVPCSSRVFIDVIRFSLLYLLASITSESPIKLQSSTGG